MCGRGIVWLFVVGRDVQVSHGSEGGPTMQRMRFPNEPQHDAAQEARDEMLEKEARQARLAGRYKAQWRISWSQVIGLLAAAAATGGLLLLLSHLGR